MSDCDVKYLAKPIECLAEAGHTGDHYGEDDAGFCIRWAQSTEYVPKAALDAATTRAEAAERENERLRAALEERGTHGENCAAYKSIGRFGSRTGLRWNRSDEKTCNCGFAAALARKET